MSYYFTMSCYHYRQMSWQLSKFYTPNKTSYSHDSYRSWWHHTLTSLDIDCYTHCYLWQHMTSAMTGLYVILKRYHLLFSLTPRLWAVLLSYCHRTVWLVVYLVPCLIWSNFVSQLWPEIKIIEPKCLHEGVWFIYWWNSFWTLEGGIIPTGHHMFTDLLTPSALTEAHITGEEAVQHLAKRMHYNEETSTFWGLFDHSK